jgi:hypothetical protein
MPLNIKSLEKGLYGENEPASTGLEVGDPRLDAITDAAFKSNYPEAAALAQSVWQEGVRDIRIIGYLLYGYYLDKDIAALAFAFTQLTRTLDDKWEAIGPAKKEKSADGGLNWLFQMLLRQLDGHERLKDSTYRSWLNDAGAKAFTDAVAASLPLMQIVEKRFPQGKCLDKLRNLSNWLNQTGTTLQNGADEERREKENAAAVAAATEAAAKAKAEAAKANDSVATVATNGGVTVEGAAALGMLMRKIRLFERLVEERALQKAAVVARDVDQLVQSFDPIVFLPKVFVPFFRLMSKNMIELEPVMQSLETPTFRSLVQLYHADLDAFAES